MKKRLLVLGLAFTMLAATACGTSSDGGSKTSKADKTVTATSNDNKKTEKQNNEANRIKAIICTYCLRHLIKANTATRRVNRPLIPAIT